MSYDVSSWFQQQAEQRAPDNIVRRFFVGSDDYSARVMKWPSLGKTWQDLRPITTTLKLANADNGMSFFREDKTNLRQNCAVEFGFAKFGYLYCPNSNDRASLTPASGDVMQSLTHSSYTVEAFVYCNTYDSGTPRGLVGRGAAFSGFTQVTTDGLSFITWPNSGASQPIYSYDHQMPDWYHLVGRQNVESLWMDFHVNGTLVGTLTIDPTPKQHGLTDPYQVGWGNSQYNPGSKYEVVRYYEGSISDENVQKLANGVDGVAETLAAHYDFTETGSLNASDVTGINSYFILQNSATMVDSGENRVRGSRIEKIKLFAGKTEKVKYHKEQIDITIADKFKQLTERVIGSNEIPVSFTASNYLPSDMAWYCITSYGGYSAIESTSNPDIDYSSFLTWAGVFSTSNIVMNAEFTGQKVAETLRKMARMTYSAIYIAEDKLTFNRFSLIDSHATILDASNIDDLVVEVDDTRMINKQNVYADYDVSSNSFNITCTDESSTSVDSFGVHEHIEKDETIWYTNSVGALDLAQRKVLIEGLPYDRLRVPTFVEGIARQVGESIQIEDTFHNIEGGYRILEQNISLETGRTELTVDRSQIFGGFTLDASSLDGADVLT